MEIKSTKNLSPIKLNCLIYGTSGSGKTSLASTLKEKTIIISLESGLLSLRNFEVDYIEITSPTPKSRYLDLQQSLLQIAKSDYINVFIDSLTDISQTFVDVCKEEFPDPRQALPMWGKYNERMNQFLKFTRDMNKNIFFTALVKTDKDDLGRRYNVPDLAGSIASRCPALFDFVFPLINYNNEDGKLERKIITQSDESYIAKDRSGSLEKYENNNLQEIINKVFNKGEK